MQLLKVVAPPMDRVRRQAIRIRVPVHDLLHRFLCQQMPLSLPDFRLLRTTVHDNAEIALDEAAHAAQMHRNRAHALQHHIRIDRREHAALRFFK